MRYKFSVEDTMRKKRLSECFKDIKSSWQPKDIAKVNDHVVRAALFEGKYHWHKHSEYDEFFYVVEGSIQMELKGQIPMKLDAGDLLVIPRGIEHRPSAKSPARVLLFEPSKLTAEGN